MADSINYNGVIPSINAPATVAQSGGMKFTMTSAGYKLKESVVVTGCTPATAYLKDSAGAVLATASFVGLKATFDPVVSLDNTTTYYIMHWNGGASYNRRYGAAAGGYPFASTNLNWIAGRDESSGTEGTGETFSIDHITLTDSEDALIEPTTLSASTTTGSPVYLITIPGGTVSATATAHPPTISYFNTETPNTGTIFVASGASTQRVVRSSYPFTEGLIAGTTKQTNNPNLVEQKW